MDSARYHTRRAEIETYFDRTAATTWETLTSDAPVSRIRRTVRKGRDEMRNTLLSWLPEDLTGARLLDAGCGTGTLAIEAARRGAEVVAIDLSPTLVSIAQERLVDLDATLPVSFRVGDMRGGNGFADSLRRERRGTNPRSDGGRDQNENCIYFRAVDAIVGSNARNRPFFP